MKPPYSELSTTQAKNSNNLADKVHRLAKMDEVNSNTETENTDGNLGSKRLTVRFPEDVASQILALGPGNFLSRSQDSLTGK